MLVVCVVWDSRRYMALSLCLFTPSVHVLDMLALVKSQ